ncbi:DUF2213 domain-containing protein [Crateriforma spongiae]|uniref:DUF2213 domain-containing protein n=1 Tax=Crateriforma spongiae TaxID=2724528 RepID=UPI0014465A40|nr:DUF2213 domain-containing protein [Crateriforma spongiae]
MFPFQSSFDHQFDRFTDAAESLVANSRPTQIAANLAASVTLADLDGREYLVAPVTMVREQVLHGSTGPMFYPSSVLQSRVERWNGVPLVLNHPKASHGYVSARSPDVLEEHSLGHVFNARFVGNAIKAEAWFDVRRTQRLAPDVYQRVASGQPVELSTGLFTRAVNRPGKFKGRPFSHRLVDYDADHFAILPQAKGACSVKDGCGVSVNSFVPSEQPLVAPTLNFSASDRDPQLTSNDSSGPLVAPVLDFSDCRVEGRPTINHRAVEAPLVAPKLDF